MSEYPSTVAYNAYDYKYGLLNLSAIMGKMEVLIKLHILMLFVHVGMPLFISKPHCLDCDPEYFKNVSGYHPCRKLHDPYSGIEPVSNIVVVTQIHSHTYTHRHIHIHAHTHTHTHAQYTHTNTHAHIHAYTCTHTYICTHMHIHTHA